MSLNRTDSNDAYYLHQNSQHSIMNISESLLTKYSTIPLNFKNRIKEILALYCQNLSDLMKSLIQVHHVLNDKVYDHLKLYEKMDYELNSWHNQIISIGLASRRDISKCMNSLQDIITTAEGGDQI